MKWVPFSYGHVTMPHGKKNKLRYGARNVVEHHQQRAM